MHAGVYAYVYTWVLWSEVSVFFDHSLLVFEAGSLSELGADQLSLEIVSVLHHRSVGVADLCHAWFSM